jgi:hypothetical protein
MLSMMRMIMLCLEADSSQKEAVSSDSEVNAVVIIDLVV